MLSCAVFNHSGDRIMAVAVYYFFIFSSALISLLLSLGQAVQKKKTSVDYIFSISFAGLSLWFLQLSLHSTGLFISNPLSWYLKIAIVPIAFSVPPLMSLRYRWIISQRLPFKKIYLIPFIPALLSILSLAMLLATGKLSFSPAINISVPFFSERMNDLPFYYQAAHLCIILPSIYLVMLMVPVLTGLHPYLARNSSSKNSNVSRAGFIFASLITTSNIIAITGFFFSMEILQASLIIAHISMCSVYLTTQRNPDYNRLLKSLVRKHHYEKSVIKGLDIGTIKERLYELMEDEKIFADEDLSLNDLARELSISPHQLSEILNGTIHKNFNTFINEYRVQEAMKLLVEEPDRSILSIGIAAGFNSNSNFNTVFTRNTGMSPGKFRKMKT